jgi:predicted ribosomally synthesized peptide with SipW-like signal peptide
MRKPSLHLTALRSTRVRAGLALGVVLAVGSTGTFAYWTDDATVSGVTFTSGTLNLAVNNNNNGTGSDGSTGGAGGSTAQTSLTMSAMAPTNSSAQLLTVKNSGTVPLKWTLSGGLTGTNASAFATGGPSSDSSLRISVFGGAVSKAGSGNSVTCSGGTALATSVQLTANSAGAIISTGQPTSPAGGLAAGGSVNLCVEVDFDPNAASDLQGQSVGATLSFAATSSVS